MSDIHATHITLHELLEHAKEVFETDDRNWKGLRSSIDYVWRNFEVDALFQQGVSSWISSYENLIDEATEDGSESFDFVAINSDAETQVRSLIATLDMDSAKNDDLILSISTFAEVLHDFVLEYLDIDNWLGDLVSVERLGERFSFHFG